MKVFAHSFFLVLLASAASLPFSIVSGQTSEISLKHSGCLGSCPVYSATLRSDGTAIYTGKFYVKRVGTYKGKIKPSDFAKLVSLIESRNFFSLQNRYDYHTIGSQIYATDRDMITVEVVRDGQRKSVEDYGGTGPAELHQIEDAIEQIIARMKWKKT
jgi:hypothetical protein